MKGDPGGERDPPMLPAQKRGSCFSTNRLPQPGKERWGRGGGSKAIKPGKLFNEKQNARRQGGGHFAQAGGVSSRFMSGKGISEAAWRSPCSARRMPLRSLREREAKNGSSERWGTLADVEMCRARRGDKDRGGEEKPEHGGNGPSRLGVSSELSMEKDAYMGRGLEQLASFFAIGLCRKWGHRSLSEGHKDWPVGLVPYREEIFGFDPSSAFELPPGGGRKIVPGEYLKGRLGRIAEKKAAVGKK